MPEKVMETGQFQYWIGPQSAQGTPAADAALLAAPAVIDGSVSMAVDAGVQRWPVYGQRFGSSVRWVNSLQGEGSLTCAAHPDVVGRLLKWYLGGTDTITGAGPYTHTLAIGAAAQWLTIVRKVGVGEGTGAGAPRIEQYADCLMTGLTIQGSSANKMVTVTPTFLVADPGISRTTTPGAAQPTDRPFVYTDGTGALKVSTTTGTAVANPDTTSFSLAMTQVVNRADGDGIVPLGFLTGESTITWTIEATAATAALTEYNQLLYNSATPFATAGNRPTATIPSAGAVEIDLNYGSAGAARQLKLASTSLQFTPSGELNTSSDGTAQTISFTAEAIGTTPVAPVIKSGTTPAYV